MSVIPLPVFFWAIGSILIIKNSCHLKSGEIVFLRSENSWSHVHVLLFPTKSPDNEMFSEEMLFECLQMQECCTINPLEACYPPSLKLTSCLCLDMESMDPLILSPILMWLTAPTSKFAEKHRANEAVLINRQTFLQSLR